MRIALTSWGFPTPYSRSMNGIASYTARTAKAMTQLGHDVTVITSHADGMPDHYQTEEGVQVYQAAKRNIHWYLSKLPLFSGRVITYVKLLDTWQPVIHKLLHLGHQFAYDVVEVSPPIPAIFPTLGRSLNTTVVSTLHGSALLPYQDLSIKPTLLDRLWGFAEQRAAHIADCLASPSQHVASFYQHAYGSTPHVISLPVEQFHYPKQSGLNLKILALGGTGIAKGSDILIPAALEDVITENNMQNIQ